MLHATGPTAGLTADPEFSAFKMRGFASKATLRTPTSLGGLSINVYSLVHTKFITLRTVTGFLLFLRGRYHKASLIYKFH